MKKNLSSAVRISENDTQIRFCFSWGKEQVTAKQLESVFLKTLQSDDRDLLNYVFYLLKQLKPEVYVGGPNPILPTEPKWHLAFQEALLIAKNLCLSVSIQNIGSSYNSNVGGKSNTAVVFVKT